MTIQQEGTKIPAPIESIQEEEEEDDAIAPNFSQPAIFSQWSFSFNPPSPNLTSAAK